jgi:hypothetical protein
LPAHLAALAGFDQLRIFSPQQFKEPLPFEDGWDALLDVRALERLEGLDAQDARLGDAARALVSARPGLTITRSLTRSRNYRGL